MSISPWFKWIWKSCCKSRHRFFFWLFFLGYFLWLVLRDRINTRNLLKRKNRQLPSYDCKLCQAHTEETLMHLLFECSFSMACWAYLGLQWDTSLMPDAMLNLSRRIFNSWIFREVLIVGSWTIWCHRNAIIFNNARVNLSRWKQCFREEMSMVDLRAKPSVKALVDQFICNLV